MHRWTALVFALTWRAVLDPRVARDLLSLVWAMRARRWYRVPPFLPFPPADYLRWRMVTAFGDEGSLPSAPEIVRYARWRRELLRL
jgi:hypothetical protein